MPSEHADHGKYQTGIQNSNRVGADENPRDEEVVAQTNGEVALMPL